MVEKVCQEIPATFIARAETLADWPMFRDAFRRNRCLIPASGYYEWMASPTGKQPYFFFVVFNALAHPTLTSLLCCLRQAIILPSPGAMPAHILSASALHRASGALAAWVDPDEITASKTNKATAN